MRQISQTFLLCVLVGICAQFGLAQNCFTSKLADDKPAIYISFDHTENNPESNKELVWLRMLNNTSCNLLVPMDQRRPHIRVMKAEDGSLIRNARGGINLESTHIILNGSNEMVVYNLFDRQKSEFRLGNLYGDVISGAVLTSGHDLLFALRPIDVRKNWALSLNLDFEGKDGIKGGFTIFYDFNNLPAEIPRSNNKF